ncbi:MAG: hypothetical protein ACFFBC_00500 [Promethearchaeota archaeon]
MNSSIIDQFLSSSEIKEFEDSIMRWLVENFSPQKEGFDSQSDTNILKNELSYVGQLENIFLIFIESVSEKYSTESAKHLYNKTVKTILSNIKIFEIKDNINLEDITKSFLSAFDTLKLDDPGFFGNQISYHQFLPETFDYLSNQIALELISSDWVVPSFWRDEVFKKILDIDETRQLKFAIKSMILFIELIKEQKKRLDDLKVKI